jgi:hypothetical protein
MEKQLFMYYDYGTHASCPALSCKHKLFTKDEIPISTSSVKPGVFLSCPIHGKVFVFENELKIHQAA